MLGIIIQVRLGSSRLPGKVLLPFWKNKSILEILLDKISSLKLNNPIIVATTTNKVDDKIEETVKLYSNVKLFRGDEDNVLKRFIDAAEENKISKIIRICADNPFLELRSLENLIQNFENSDSDYYCYKVNGKPSILSHFGFWAEGVSLNALKKVQKYTDENIYIEHVTNFIYTNNKEFNIIYDTVNFNGQDKSIRLTLDTKEDFNIQQEIYADIMNKFPNHQYTIKDLVNYLNGRPKYLQFMETLINQQKK